MRKPARSPSSVATQLSDTALQAVRGGDGETAESIEKARAQNQRRVEFKLVTETTTTTP